MTPQERKLLDELFDRLASLENGPRDPEAMRTIQAGLARAPNALYPLVQSVLVQDEALKRADARIRELESELGIGSGQPPQQQPGFLDNMRDTLFGRRVPEGSQGSVPSVRPGGGSVGGGVSGRSGGVGGPAGGTSGGVGSRSPWGAAGAQPMTSQPMTSQPMTSQPMASMPPQSAPPGSSGGSFLGTAAAAAAGVVGGALLMNSFRGMFGGGAGGSQHQAFGGLDAGGGGTPWNSGPGAGGGDLARQIGIDDIGRSERGGGGGFDRGGDPSGDRVGLFDTAERDSGGSDSDFGSDVAGDFGGGDSDSA